MFRIIMDSSDFQKNSLWERVKALFSRPEAEGPKADDFSTEKSVIAAYKNSVVESPESRLFAANPSSAAPNPSQPPEKAAYRAPERPARKKPASAEKPSQPAFKKSERYSYSGNSWNAPHILKTNLISGEVTTFVSWNAYVRKAVFSLALSLLMVGAVFAGLLYWEASVSRANKDLALEIEKLDNEIDELRERTKEADFFQRRLNLSQELLDNHIYWTEFFRLFEGLFLKDARLTGSFEGDLSGAYSLQMTVPSFTGIYEQLLALRAQPAVKEIRVNSGTLEEAKTKGAANEEKKVSFTLDISIDPEILRIRPKKSNE